MVLISSYLLVCVSIPGFLVSVRVGRVLLLAPLSKHGRTLGSGIQDAHRDHNEQDFAVAVAAVSSLLLPYLLAHRHYFIFMYEMSF